MTTTPEREARYMRAYFHTFTPTGCDPVDAMLEAVALAGKAYHYTGDWTEVEWDRIQDRANEAAAALAASPAAGGPQPLTDEQKDAMHAVVTKEGRYRNGLLPAMWNAALTATPPAAAAQAMPQGALTADEAVALLRDLVEHCERLRDPAREVRAARAFLVSQEGAAK